MEQTVLDVTEFAVSHAPIGDINGRRLREETQELLESWGKIKESLKGPSREYDKARRQFLEELGDVHFYYERIIELHCDGYTYGLLNVDLVRVVLNKFLNVIHPRFDEVSTSNQKAIINGMRKDVLQFSEMKTKLHNLSISAVKAIDGQLKYVVDRNKDEILEEKMVSNSKL